MSLTWLEEKEGARTRRSIQDGAHGLCKGMEVSGWRTQLKLKGGGRLSTQLFATDIEFHAGTYLAGVGSTVILKARTEMAVFESPPEIQGPRHQQHSPEVPSSIV